MPRQSATVIGHNRRTIAGSDGPPTICQTFVRSEGTISRAAASTGGMTIARSPIEMVGNPIPMTPLIKPASANTSPMNPSHPAWPRACCVSGQRATAIFRPALDLWHRRLG
nr:MAG: hypothetical protein DIU57_03665 [Pseudomonadota bacterium]